MPKIGSVKTLNVRKIISLDIRSLGELLFLELFFCYTLPSLGFLLGITVGWYTLPLAFTAAVTVFALIRKGTSGLLSPVVASLLCWAVAIAVAFPFIDRSYDGNGYHQEIVGALYSGWLPVDPNSWTGIPLSMWTLHYAKALEIAESSVVAFTGLFEAGKCVNSLLAVSSGFILFGFLSSRFPDVRTLWRWAVVAVALCNPVVICQSLTFYIDYAKYLFTLLSIVYLLEICFRGKDKNALFMFCCVVVFAAGTKFNAFFEVGVVVFACIVWLVSTRRIREAWSIAWVAALSAVVGAVIVGWHPYVTNLLSAGHPLYPLMGEGRVDIMTSNTPEHYLQHGRFFNFFHSLFSVNIPTIDTREGGFGFFMVPMLAFALYAVWKSRKKFGYVPLYICGCILVSCFFFEQSWWARYISQLWLIPVLGISVAVCYGKQSRPLKVSAWTILVCAILTGMMSLASSLGAALRHTLYRHAVYESLKGQTVRVYNINESHRLHLQDADIIGIPAESILGEEWVVPYYGTLSEWKYCSMMLLDSTSYVKVSEAVDAIPLFDYGYMFDYDGNVGEE